MLVQACPGKSVGRSTDHPAMTIAVDLGRKATKQTNKTMSAKAETIVARVDKVKISADRDNLIIKIFLAISLRK